MKPIPLLTADEIRDADTATIAAGAGAWLHGEAGKKLGRFFTAEDLISAIG